MHESIIFKEPMARHFSTDQSEGQRNDQPEISDDPRTLYTLPYAKLIDGLTDIIYPVNNVTSSSGKTITVRASEARVDRYVFFRAAWDNKFAESSLKALQVFTILVFENYQNHFIELTEDQKNEAIALLENGKLTEKLPQYDIAYQKSLFKSLHGIVSEGLFSEPGYGGNNNGIGWYYSNFMSLEEV